MTDTTLVRDFMARVEKTMKIVEKFDKARAGRKPYSAQGACPVCRAGTVHYRYWGPRAVRMSCDNPKCDVRMMS